MLLDLEPQIENFCPDFRERAGKREGGGGPFSLFPSFSPEVSIQSFEFVRPISRGAYGRVFLAKKKKTEDVFAIKILKKDGVTTERQRQNLSMEVRIHIYIPTHHSHP